MRRVLSIAACLLAAAGEVAAQALADVLAMTMGRMDKDQQPLRNPMALEPPIWPEKAHIRQWVFKVRQYVAPLLAIVAMHAPMKSDAATEISHNDSQNNGSRFISNVTVKNSNPGAVFNSASVDLLSQFAGPLNHALANNSALSGITINQLLSTNQYVKISIDNDTLNPELVNQGWNFSLSGSTGILSFTNNGLIPDITFDVWRSSTDGTPHTLKYTVVFGDNTSSNPKLKNIFDLNGDGLVQAEERLITEAEGWALLGLPAPPSAVVAAGFEGVMNINNTYTAELPRYWLLGAWWERMRAEGLARAALRVEREAGGGVSLRHGALAGLRYTVERSTTLAAGSFQPVLGPLSVPAPQELTHPLSDPGPGPVFYRLRIEVVED